MVYRPVTHKAPQTGDTLPLFELGMGLLVVGVVLIKKKKANKYVISSLCILTATGVLSVSAIEGVKLSNYNQTFDLKVGEILPQANISIKGYEFIGYILEDTKIDNNELPSKEIIQPKKQYVPDYDLPKGKEGKSKLSSDGKTLTIPVGTKPTIEKELTNDGYRVRQTTYKVDEQTGQLIEEAGEWLNIVTKYPEKPLFAINYKSEESLPKGQRGISKLSPDGKKLTVPVGTKPTFEKEKTADGYKVRQITYSVDEQTGNISEQAGEWVNIVTDNPETPTVAIRYEGNVNLPRGERGTPVANPDGKTLTISVGIKPLVEDTYRLTQQGGYEKVKTTTTYNVNETDGSITNNQPTSEIAETVNPKTVVDSYTEPTVVFVEDANSSAIAGTKIVENPGERGFTETTTTYTLENGLPKANTVVKVVPAKNKIVKVSTKSEVETDPVKGIRTITYTLDTQTGNVSRNEGPWKPHAIREFHATNPTHFRTLVKNANPGDRIIVDFTEMIQGDLVIDKNITVTGGTGYLQFRGVNIQTKADVTFENIGLYFAQGDLDKKFTVDGGHLTLSNVKTNLPNPAQDKIRPEIVVNNGELTLNNPNSDSQMKFDKIVTTGTSKINVNDPITVFNGITASDDTDIKINKTANSIESFTGGKLVFTGNDVNMTDVVLKNTKSITVTDGAQVVLAKGLTQAPTTGDVIVGENSLLHIADNSVENINKLVLDGTVKMYFEGSLKANTIEKDGNIDIVKDIMSPMPVYTGPNKDFVVATNVTGVPQVSLNLLARTKEFVRDNNVWRVQDKGSTVNKSELELSIADANDYLPLDQYTKALPALQKYFDDILNEAKKIKDLISATQDQVNKINQELIKAMDLLDIASDNVVKSVKQDYLFTYLLDTNEAFPKKYTEINLQLEEITITDKNNGSVLETIKPTISNSQVQKYIPYPMFIIKNLYQPEGTNPYAVNHERHYTVVLQENKTFDMNELINTIKAMTEEIRYQIANTAKENLLGYQELTQEQLNQLFNGIFDKDKYNGYVLEEINCERKAQNIAPLVLHDEFKTGSKTRIDEQVGIGFFRSVDTDNDLIRDKPHYRPNGEYFYSAFTYAKQVQARAENMGIALAPDIRYLISEKYWAQRQVALFKTSESHNKEMMNPLHTVAYFSTGFSDNHLYLRHQQKTNNQTLTALPTDENGTAVIFGQVFGKERSLVIPK